MPPTAALFRRFRISGNASDDKRFRPIKRTSRRKTDLVYRRKSTAREGVAMHCTWAQVGGLNDFHTSAFAVGLRVVGCRGADFRGCAPARIVARLWGDRVGLGHGLGSVDDRHHFGGTGGRELVRSDLQPSSPLRRPRGRDWRRRAAYAVRFDPANPFL